MKATMYTGTCFAAGALWGMTLLCLYQDIMGKDRYLAWVSEHWVDSNISAPVECVILATCTLVYLVTMDVSRFADKRRRR